MSFTLHVSEHSATLHAASLLPLFFTNPFSFLIIFLFFFF